MPPRRYDVRVPVHSFLSMGRAHSDRERDAIDRGFASDAQTLSTYVCLGPGDRFVLPNTYSIHYYTVAMHAWSTVGLSSWNRLGMQSE